MLSQVRHYQAVAAVRQPHSLLRCLKLVLGFLGAGRRLTLAVTRVPCRALPCGACGGFSSATCDRLPCLAAWPPPHTCLPACPVSASTFTPPFAPSWYDAEGVAHAAQQAEGGEKGDLKCCLARGAELCAGRRSGVHVTFVAFANSSRRTFCATRPPASKHAQGCVPTAPSHSPGRLLCGPPAGYIRLTVLA